MFVVHRALSAIFDVWYKYVLGGQRKRIHLPLPMGDDKTPAVDDVCFLVWMVSVIVRESFGGGKVFDVAYFLPRNHTRHIRAGLEVEADQTGPYSKRVGKNRLCRDSRLLRLGLYGLVQLWCLAEQAIQLGL